MKIVFLIFTIISLALPYYFFISFLNENGFDLNLMINYLRQGRLQPVSSTSQ